MLKIGGTIGAGLARAVAFAGCRAFLAAETIVGTPSAAHNAATGKNESAQENLNSGIHNLTFQFAWPLSPRRFHGKDLQLPERR